MTDFETLKHRELPNWGAWSRQDSDRPDPNRCTGSIYGRGRVEDEGHAEGAVGEAIRYVDEKAAAALDLSIRRLTAAHLRAVKATYYRRVNWSPTDLELDAAIRGLVDVLHAGIDEYRY